MFARGRIHFQPASFSRRTGSASCPQNSASAASAAAEEKSPRAGKSPRKTPRAAEEVPAGPTDPTVVVAQITRRSGSSGTATAKLQGRETGDAKGRWTSIAT